MADLTYNLDELTALGDDLERLATQLRSDGDLQDVGLDEVASSRVQDALANFADDWDNKREELANDVSAVAEMAKTAASGFRENDDELADAVRELLDGDEP